MNPNYTITSIDKYGVVVEIDFVKKLFTAEVAINKPDEEMKYKTVKTSKQSFRIDDIPMDSKEALKIALDEKVLMHYSTIMNNSIDTEILDMISTPLIVEDKIIEPIQE